MDKETLKNIKTTPLFRAVKGVIDAADFEDLLSCDALNKEASRHIGADQCSPCTIYVP